MQREARDLQEKRDNEAASRAEEASRDRKAVKKRERKQNLKREKKNRAASFSSSAYSASFSSSPPPPPTLQFNDNQSITSSLGEDSNFVAFSAFSTFSGVVPSPQLPSQWKVLTRNLSANISRFSHKRSVALVQRRKEREALLDNLNEHCRKIFPASDVLPYGSCATGLDLPSSDLDIVVSAPRTRGANSAKTKKFMKPATIQTNLKKLAHSLSALPWAVQVKSVLTTAVPVIKILADPTSLLPLRRGSPKELASGRPPVHPSSVPRGSVGHDVFLNPIPPSSTSSSAPSGLSSPSPRSSPSHPISPPYSPNLTSWRGADTHNNLISVDISLETPSHSGVLSSSYVDALLKDDAEHNNGVLVEVTLV